MTLFENLLGHTLIAADNVWGLMGVMCIGVALSIHLEQKYQWASKVSGAVIALIMAMVLANLGVIPTNCTLYDDIVWGIVVPMAIPLLLLQCNLSRVWKDTGRMLVVFLIGALGTVVGAFLAYYLLRGPFGDAQGLAKVASMMTGSYIGGGVNFAAMASQYAAGDDLTAAATVADNLLMAAYFFVLIACAGSKFFRKHFSHPHIAEVEAGASKEVAQTQAAAFWSRKDISLKDIAYNFAYAIVVVWVSRIISGIITIFSTSIIVFTGCRIIEIVIRCSCVVSTTSETAKHQYAHHTDKQFSYSPHFSSSFQINIVSLLSAIFQYLFKRNFLQFCRFAAKFLHRSGLNLTYAFSCHIQFITDFFQRMCFSIFQTKSQADHLTFSVIKRL